MITKEQRDLLRNTSDPDLLVNMITDQDTAIEKMKQDELMMEEKISKLSSQVSLLKEQNLRDTQTINSKNEEIGSLNERIGRLHESDKELKEAKRLMSEALEIQSQNKRKDQELDDREKLMEREMQDYTAMCDAKVAEISTRCQIDNEAAEKNLADAKLYKEKAANMYKSVEHLVDKKADEKINDELRSLRSRAKRHLSELSAINEVKYAVNREKSRIAFIIFMILTAVQIILSEKLHTDAESIWEWLSDKAVWGYELIENWVSAVSLKFEGEDILEYLMPILVALLPMLVLAGVLIACGIVVYRYVTNEDKFDEWARWITVGSGFVLLSATQSEIDIIEKWNIILVWLVIQVMVAVSREALRKWKIKHNPSYGVYDMKGQIVGVLAVVVVIGIAVGGVFWLRWVVRMMSILS